MNPALHDAHAALVRSDRERAAIGPHAQLDRDVRHRRASRTGPRQRLSRALIAAGNRLAH